MTTNIELIESQIDGLLEGEGASEDHEDVLKFLRSTGLSDALVKRVHKAIVNAERLPKFENIDSFVKLAAVAAMAQTDEDHPYIREARADIAKFEPHAWVLNAIKGGVKAGYEQAEHENSFLLQQMQEKHEQDENGVMRASVAAVMEVFMQGNETFTVGKGHSAIDTLTVTVNMEEQRTIWDRFGLQCVLSDDKKTVTWTLTSNKALPKAE